MKTTFLVLPVLVLASLSASAQYAPGRNQRANNPSSGANSSTGAEYAAVSVAGTGGAINQGNRGNLRQQGQVRRGAEFVAVSIAPRRR